MTQVSLALSGSGFKLACFVGALQAFKDADYQVMEVAGTSGGSIIGGLYASGMSPETMHELVMKTDFAALMPWNWWGWWNGLSNSDPLYQWILGHTGHATCGQTTIPYTAISSDIASESTYVFSTGTTPEIEVAQASRCSASIPFIYQSQKVGNALLVDGGVRNNIPVNHLSKKYPRIGLMLTSQPTLDPNPSFLSYAGRLIDSMLSANEKTRQMLAFKTQSQILEIPTFGISMLDRKMSAEDRIKLYNSGYEVVEKFLDSSEFV